MERARLTKRYPKQLSANRLRDGKWGGAAADLAGAARAGPSRLASHDTARPEPIGEGQPQKNTNH